MAPVIGSNGRDVVWEPTQFYSDKTKQSYGEFASKHPNVSIITSLFESPALPKDYADFVILNHNYHDTYWRSEKRNFADES